MSRVVQHPVQGFLAALAAVGTLSIMDAVMKHLVLAIGIFAVSVWRAAANLVVASAMYLPAQAPWPDRRVMRVHVARSVIITVMAFLFFWGIGRVPLAQAIALTFIAPLIALLLASAFLHEQIGRRSVLGSLAAFGGVIVIVFGQAESHLGPDALLGTFAIIGSALCYAVNIVLMRHQALAAKPLEITFFQARNFHLNIDTIKKRPRKPGPVTTRLIRCAHTAPQLIATIAAWTGVAGTNKQK